MGHEDWYAVGYDSVQYFEGRLLTLIDAAIPDSQQCKAMKDIARTVLWDWIRNSSARVSYEDVKFMSEGEKYLKSVDR